MSPICHQYVTLSTVEMLICFAFYGAQVDEKNLMTKNEHVFKKLTDIV